MGYLDLNGLAILWAKIKELFALKSLLPTQLSDFSDDSTHRVVTDAEKSTWNNKQSALTFDNTPTAESNNPVTSDGIKAALDLKVNVGSEDSAMSSTSTNSVQNKVIKLYVDDKSDDTLTKFVRYDINNLGLTALNKANARLNIDSENIIIGYYTATDIDEDHPAGFYADSQYTTFITDEYISRKLYIDVNTMMLYNAWGGTLHPISGEPIVGASYDSVNKNVVINLTNSSSITIPVQDWFLTYTGGKGITISGSEISLSYLVVSLDTMNEVLAGGDDDGIIRYVYEEE